ncbi:restriction endonuclease subunit S [Bacillus cereus group sp. BCN115]|uniref:restriction endonuclease subunit S n=1 Tax=Bacillus cereus group sp. BCN115 TaxID=3450575 RepID=UPI003F78E151
MEFKDILLKDCLEIIIDYRGKTPKKLGGDWAQNGNYRAISAKNIKNNKLVNIDAIKTVDKDIYLKWMKEEIKKEDILLTSEAPLGETVLWDSDEKIVLSQRVFGLRTKKDILYPKYLWAFMQSRFFKHEIISRESGTTVTGIRRSELEKVKIQLPEYQNQKFIGDLFYTINSKIKTNEEIQASIEKASQLLFKHWFIDFEFPNEQGQPYKSSGGEMVGSELGEIPKGWHVDTLDSIGIFKNGKKISSTHRREDAKNKIFGSNGIIGYTDLILQEEPCIVVGRVGANCGSVQISINPCWVTDNAIIATLKEFKYFSFLYRILSQSSLKERAGGSAQPLINQNILKSIKAISPSSNLIENYNELSYKNAQLADALQSENDKLKQLRDTLLPKLLSGEIEIPDEMVVD